MSPWHRKLTKKSFTIHSSNPCIMESIHCSCISWWKLSNISCTVSSISFSHWLSFPLSSSCGLLAETSSTSDCCWFPSGETISKSLSSSTLDCSWFSSGETISKSLSLSSSFCNDKCVSHSYNKLASSQWLNVVHIQSWILYFVQNKLLYNYFSYLICI